MNQPAPTVGAVTTYDSIPYESNPFEYTHPANLATIAGLFGLPAADPAHCRVLELGCGSGGNLIPMAVTAPHSTFVGVDAAPTQIARGQALIDALGLTNIRLECRNIMDVDARYGAFDYVICHGVYSWVPPEVQAKILELGRTLTPATGVAYVSYNTYPGWHQRAVVREMMNFHARGFDDDRERIAQSRALLQFLVKVAPENTAYGRLLREEHEVLRIRADDYLFHEHLEANNAPVYFHEFVTRAESAGLRYLGEAALQSMLPAAFPPDVQETLQRIAPDIIRLEQYLDFLRNRTFRRSLLCHEEVPLERALGPQTLREYRVSSALEPRDSAPKDDPADDGLVFEHPAGQTVTVRTPLEQAALLLLADRAPASMAVADLAAAAARRSGAGHDLAAAFEQIGSLVLQCVAGGILELHRYPDLFTLEPGDRPRTTSLALHQSRGDDGVTNLRHSLVSVGPFDRTLLGLLDGTRDREALCAEMVAQVAAGKLKMKIKGADVGDPAVIAEVIPPAVELSLTKLARDMLLLA